MASHRTHGNTGNQMTIPFEEWDVPAVSAAENTEKTTARRPEPANELDDPKPLPGEKRPPTGFFTTFQSAPDPAETAAT